MDKLQFEVCHERGLCDTGDFDLEGQLIWPGRDGGVDGITITVHPSGEYASWAHNALHDALRAAVHQIAECEDVTNTPTCGNPMSYCPCT